MDRSLESMANLLAAAMSLTDSANEGDVFPVFFPAVVLPAAVPRAAASGESTS